MSKKTKPKTVEVQKQVVATAVKEIMASAKPTQRKLTDLVIASNADYEAAGKHLKILKGISKVVDTEKGKIINPIKESIKNTEAFFKPFTDEVKQIEVEVKAKMLAWVEKQETKSKQLEADLDSGKIKSIGTFHRKNSELTVQSQHSQLREIKVLEITNLKKIPYQYLLPNETKIREALLAGKKIAGCKLNTKKSLAV